MRLSTLQDEFRAASDLAPGGSAIQAVLARMQEMLRVLEEVCVDPATPERTRERTEAFLRHILAARRKLGRRLLQPAFLLNVVGEGMARANLISRPVVHFLQVGLYFFGLQEIERRWSARAAVYSGIHADHLGEYLTRRSLKALLGVAQERISSGRIFCLTYHYLNSLRKAYWVHCRSSEDVLDVALTGSEMALDERTQPGVGSFAEALPGDAGDKVALMLAIFRRDLSPRQRWIYLAKNRSALAKDGQSTSTADTFDSLLEQLGEGRGPDADLGWAEIAGQQGINEKTAKREYLRSLHILLQQSAEAVFGSERIPSHYVRRVLRLIREVVGEKDLRLRHVTGRGLDTLVEKWEVALRFVLNHSRVPA